MNRKITIELAPLGVSFEVEPGSSLAGMLAAYGVEFPCGGSKLCGRCRIRVLEGSLPPAAEDGLVLTDAEIAAGWRLGCHARPDEPVKVAIEQWTTPIFGDESPAPSSLRTGSGIAVDVGTTTLVAQMVDLTAGELLAVHSELNPQIAHGNDVMNRVQFALRDPDLTIMIRRAVGMMVTEFSDARRPAIEEVVLVGNTVMHHLFAGLDVEPLSHVPFESPNLDEQVFDPDELNWRLPSSCRIRFLPCIGGFVGSDILAGIVAVNMPAQDGLTALLDLGTNGEIALGNRERILCASTAAGPAFEAVSIRMGMRAATGAIWRVGEHHGRLDCDVIGNVEPRGICGSGLVDAVAAGLDLGAILPSGKLANGTHEFLLRQPVRLYQSDVRALQLAKGAIAAGLRTLLMCWGAKLDDLETVYLAGAFGNYVRVESARRVGLLEVAPSRVIPVGNTALRGAKLVLGSGLKLLPTRIEHVSLASEPHFEAEFVNCLGFPGL